ncbi:MAG: hypothetical protein IJK31_06110 [Ruminococcus sp.]|nr:hypothetical protein [Ruminococcus sp.]HRR76420.1 hypothetical protein [Ruminococcus sp.]
MKNYKFKISIVALLSAVCLTACGDTASSSQEKKTASDSEVSVSDADEISVSENGGNNDDSEPIIVDATNYSAVVNSDKWFTEDDPNDTIVKVFGVKYNWTEQKDAENPSAVTFGPTLEDFRLDKLDQEKLNGETDINKVFIMIAESRNDISYVDVQLSEIVEHSGIKMSHVRSYIKYKSVGVNRPNTFQDEYIFYAGGAMNEIVMAYTDDEDGHAAYEDFAASIIDNITLKE